MYICIQYAYHNKTIKCSWQTTSRSYIYWTTSHIIHLSFKTYGIVFDYFFTSLLLIIFWNQTLLLLLMLSLLSILWWIKCTPPPQKKWNKSVDIKFSSHDAFLEWHSTSTPKVKIFESQIISLREQENLNETMSVFCITIAIIFSTSDQLNWDIFMSPF